MKVAILFAGRVGLAAITHNNTMHNIVVAHDVDFYLSTDASLTEDIEEFKSVYSPVRVNLETIPEDDFVLSIPENMDAAPKRAVQCQFYNKQRAYQEMEKSGRIYDVVILYRTDINIETQLNLSLEYNNNTVYIPEGSDYLGINDQIAFGSMAAMKVYTSLYSSMPVYYAQGIRYLGEPQLKKHLETSGIHVVRVKFAYNIIRPKGWDELGRGVYYKGRLTKTQH